MDHFARIHKLLTRSDLTARSLLADFVLGSVAAIGLATARAPGGNARAVEQHRGRPFSWSPHSAAVTHGCRLEHAAR